MSERRQDSAAVDAKGPGTRAGARDPGGTEPDYRFTLADERTMLAYVRTALSLIAAAVALVKLVPPFALPGMREVAGVLLAVTGVAAAVLAPYRYVTVERAMRRGGPLPAGRVLLLVPTAVAVVGALVLVVAVAEGGPW
jgi:putative membrane protein